MAVIDLGKLNELREKDRMIKESASPLTTTGTTQTGNDVNFLGALASAANKTEDEQTKVAVSGQSFEKMERIHKRIDHLASRFELLERKIERIERRIDLKY